MKILAWVNEQTMQFRKQAERRGLLTPWHWLFPLHWPRKCPLTGSNWNGNAAGVGGVHWEESKPDSVISLDFLHHRGNQVIVNWKCRLVHAMYSMSQDTWHNFSAKTQLMYCDIFISRCLNLDFQSLLSFSAVTNSVLCCKALVTDGRIRPNRVYQAFLFAGMNFLMQMASSTTLSLIMDYLLFQCCIACFWFLKTVVRDVLQLWMPSWLSILSQCFDVRVLNFVHEGKKNKQKTQQKKITRV